MLKFYGSHPPADLNKIEVGGVCPNCGEVGKFIKISVPDIGKIRHNHLTYVTIDYACALCEQSIPVRWHINGIETDHIIVDDALSVKPIRPQFDYEYVPDDVKKEIEEALICLSGGAYNGFAATCRRSIQAICTNLGAEATDKVKYQIDEMASITGLDDEWKELAYQIMLAGHDGAHPHLPEVDAERADLLLTLLRDIAYQLYTRPGKIKASAELRKKAIATKKEAQE